MDSETSSSQRDGGSGGFTAGMSADNIKGLILALSSSVFIGASFIVKKKGLKKAGASGVRAGKHLINLGTVDFYSFADWIFCDLWI